MHKIGWDKLVAKSERLTCYLLAFLKRELSDQIQFITPEDPAERGATLVFQIKGVPSLIIEQVLATAGYEIDVRPPNNIRVTAHYGYTSFMDIHNMVHCLKQVVRQELLKKESLKSISKSAPVSQHSIFTSAAGGLTQDFAASISRGAINYSNGPAEVGAAADEAGASGP